MLRRLRGMVASLLFSRRVFEFLQRFRIHLIRNAEFNPVPDTGSLARRKGFWDTPSDLVGVDMNVGAQLDFLQQVLPRYAGECVFPRHETGNPHQYYSANTMFGPLSALVLHSMIRHFRPRVMFELGSGFSTLVAAAACRLNQQQGHNTDFLVINPYPDATLRNGIPGLSRLRVEKAEDVGLEPFQQLGQNDILFIDTTHVVKTGGDVGFLMLEVLPRLRPGVLIHIHDIFFPFDYPRAFVLDKLHFYSEQYLLQAFLLYNRRFEVLWCESYLCWKYAAELQKSLPAVVARAEKNLCSSFWMRKTAPAPQENV